MPEGWKNCRIGSCQRNERCMYRPCRSHKQKPCKHEWEKDGYIRPAIIVYVCRLCGETYEKDVS